MGDKGAGLQAKSRGVMDELSISTHLHHIELTVMQQLYAEIYITYTYLQSLKLQVQFYRDPKCLISQDKTNKQHLPHPSKQKASKPQGLIPRK